MVNVSPCFSEVISTTPEVFCEPIENLIRRHVFEELVVQVVQPVVDFDYVSLVLWVDAKLFAS
jgi:hypothetical protein